MTGEKPPETPSPDVMEVAESIVSSANVTTCDGYYEVDIDAAATVIAEAKARWEREALERAAQVAEAQQMLAKDGYDLTGFYGENFRCRTTAALIRALKEPRP